MNEISHKPSLEQLCICKTARAKARRFKRKQPRHFLLPIFLALFINQNNRGQSGKGLCLAAEALVTPYLHQRSFLLRARGGSIADPVSQIETTTLRNDGKKFSSLKSAVTTNGAANESMEDFSSDSDDTAAMFADDDNASEELLLTRFVAETNLPTDIGQFRLRAYRICSSTRKGAIGEYVGKEPVVIYSRDKPPGSLGNGSGEKVDVPVRIHDQCFTSEVFRSQRCDCREQLNMALNYVQKNGGAIIYLQQEGRGIGIANKIAAYALQDKGFDTVDANVHLGFPEDARQYGVVPSILSDMGIESIQLMTNNPRKIARLKNLGVAVKDTLPMVVPRPNKYNRKYLQTKRERMNHTNFGSMLSLDDADTVSQVLSGISAPKTIPETKNGKIDPHTAEFLNDEEGQSGVQASSDGYCFGRKSVEDAIAAVARGELVVVVDDESRENEGDFIMAADLCTPETMAEIVRYSSGVICVGMEGERMDELQLPAMVTNNQDPKGTAFSVTVDATVEHGITTGISAKDRAKTVQLLASSKTTHKDFLRPGHIFPLRAKENGVLTRDGHTEAAVDLSRLAGSSPVGVLCEIVSEEHPTEMARLPELKRFCKRHGYVLTSIVDIAQYRRDTEK